MTYEGTTPDPWGGTRAAFSARGEIEREQWDMTWNVTLETGGVLVSKKIQLEIDAQAVRPKEAVETAAEQETKAEDEAAEPPSPEAAA